MKMNRKPRVAAETGRRLDQAALPTCPKLRARGIHELLLVRAERDHWRQRKEGEAPPRASGVALWRSDRASGPRAMRQRGRLSPQLATILEANTTERPLLPAF